MEHKQTLSIDLLRLSADENALSLLVSPVHSTVSVASLTQLFNRSEYANFKLNVTALNDAVKHFDNLDNNTSKNNKAQSLVIARRTDAQLAISVDEHKVQAKAVITSAYGGSAISFEQFKTEMDRFTITHGIIKKNISLLLDKSQLAKPGTCFQATIAKGRPPIHGTDSVFERLVETPQQRLLRPKKNSDGSVDMRDLGQLMTVKIGEALMRKLPHTGGAAGINVSGETIEHKPGNDIPFEIGKNTQICTNDENLLIATLAGIPKTLSNGMKVDDVLVVNNVDVGSGHIDYAGSVIVQGDVCDAMKVKATGDITISGFVESAQLECDGDLIVGKGILGRQIEEPDGSYSCNINCKGSVTAHFSQYARIVAGTEVNIKTQLLHCCVTSQGNINVIDDMSNKGCIMGGTLKTAGSVNTVSLGATAGSKTRIDLVGNFPKLIQSKNTINRTIDDAQAKLKSLIDAQCKVDILPSSDKKKMIVGRLRVTKAQVREQIAQLNADLEANKQAVKQYFEKTNVITKKEVFNDVYIAIGSGRFRSMRHYGPTKVSIKNNKILAEPYNS